MLESLAFSRISSLESYLKSRIAVLLFLILAWNQENLFKNLDSWLLIFLSILKFLFLASPYFWNFQKLDQARIKNFKKLKNSRSQESRFFMRFSWFQARIKKCKTAILDFKRDSRLEIREEERDSSKTWDVLKGSLIIQFYRHIHIFTFFVISKVHKTYNLLFKTLKVKIRDIKNFLS